MTINVKFGSSYKRCTPVNDGVCKHCGAEIVWATTPAGKFIPLNRDAVSPGVMEAHFGRACRPRPVSPSEPAGAGIQMSETMWRQLMRLVHPDRHHGGEDERLANDMTRWLLEQRPRLTKN